MPWGYGAQGMQVRLAIICLLLSGMALGSTVAPWAGPLAAQDAGGGDGDDGDGGDDGGGDDPVEDPDDQDPVGDDPGADDPGADDPGGDDAGGGDDPGGDDAGGGDDGAGGDDAGGGDAGDDDGGAAGSGSGGDDDGGAAGGDDDDNAGATSGGGDDDDGAAAGAGGDDDNATGGDDDAAGGRDDDDDGAGDLDDDPGQWLLAGGETEAERAALDARDGIEADGEGFRYRRGEFVALDLAASDLAELQASGFTLVETTRLGSVEGTLTLLRGPAQLTDAAALDMLEALADPDTIGFNHLFDGSSVQTRRTRASAPPQRVACGCQIGLIDTGIATDLAYFRHITLSQRAFNAKAPQPRLHGTAVAHLMAGTRANPAARTRIFVADIFAGPRETAGSSLALIKALDWLAGQGVPVINISLAGPRNPAVASAIARINRRGHVIVAAAGNDGPAAPPVFPGAYDNVVGVTAVDRQNRVYRYANRGQHVDFSARGVAVPAIDARGGVRDATGTSFAAPLVAARLASRLARPDPAAARAAIRALEAEARDLGPRGRDPIYGAGLVGGGE